MAPINFGFPFPHLDTDQAIDTQKQNHNLCVFMHDKLLSSSQLQGLREIFTHLNPCNFSICGLFTPIIWFQ